MKKLEKVETSGGKTERLSALRDLVSRFPNSPGVYLMKDRQGSVIYVGKAKNLKSRVKSYFNGTDERYNVQYLLTHVRHIETISTVDERQAIFLEMDLIHKHKPRYNIRLKDDKAPFLVRIDMTADWPRLELVRRRFNGAATYIGPFPHTFELRALLEVIKNAIPLRSCPDRVLHNRVRPCLEYQIKRCLGPCCLEVDEKHYRALLEQAVAVLEGRNEEVAEQLRREMIKTSEELRFEDAAVIRDRLAIIERIKTDQNEVSYSKVEGLDAFGYYREGTSVEVSVVQVRYGRIAGGESYGFSDVIIEDRDVLEAVLEQFYDRGREIPEEIVLPDELSEGLIDLLREKREGSLSCFVPQRGTKFRLLELALNNARENFFTRFAGNRHGDDACRALQKELQLEQVPRVIECVDISHFQGASTVASAVCFRDGAPDKNRYRHFHLSQQGKPDDFASMREVVMRHLSRQAEEGNLPDLLVVDGGPQQLVQALHVRAELGLSDLKIIGLAKKRSRGTFSYRLERTKRISAKPERVFMSPDEPPIILKPGSAELNLLEQIRDEAHRFAITFHRKIRSDNNFRSFLDGIPGIGPERKKAILRIYSSSKRVMGATPEELSAKCGLPINLAERVVILLRNREKANR